MEKIEWICTDPDTKQYGRQISEKVFEFKENGSDEMTIDLDHYSDDQIKRHISAYYDSLDQLKEIYGSDSNWIIAECIFERES